MCCVCMYMRVYGVCVYVWCVLTMVKDGSILACVCVSV